MAATVTTPSSPARVEAGCCPTGRGNRESSAPVFAFQTATSDPVEVVTTRDPSGLARVQQPRQVRRGKAGLLLDQVGMRHWQRIKWRGSGRPPDEV